MNASRERGGFALVTVVVLTAIVLAGVGALGAFVAHGMRLTRVHLAESRCRMAAQCAIEALKVDVQNAFDAYTGADAKIDPRQTVAYNWFYTVASDGRSIGITDAKHEALALSDPPAGINDCAVRLGVGAPPTGGDYPVVPLYATAVFTYPDGLRVSVTVRERVLFGVSQSPVFDYAYFVNNYGWMSGSSIVINGDMRANGNVSLSGSTVNGFVYAAVNDEVGANGTVSLSSSPQIKNAATYRSSYGNRSRPDRADYDTSGAYDAPQSSGTIRKTTYRTDSDGNLVYDDDGKPIVTGGTVTANEGKAIVNEDANSIPMPYVSDLDSYVEYAKDYDNGTGGKGGTLTAPAYSYTDGAGATHAVAAKTVAAHYEGTGPSGDSTLADDGALVLIGTQANPIVIDGPVVVDSDVVIKGYVKGQGTIYSGRNVHVIGDVKYVNAPTWSHPDADDDAVETRNATSDMLGLVAKGNIVIGDSTSSSWHTSVDSYIKSGTSSSVVKKYACDPSDANIGYPSTFQGNYTAVEQVSGLSGTQAAEAPGGYDSASGQFGKVRTVTRGTGEYETTRVAQYDRWGRLTGYKDVTKEVTETVCETAYDRKYYETVCDDRILSSLKDSYGISQIDAVLYNNHGIFGTPGRSGYNFNLNGALVCRDEALIFSGNGIRFNWDFRLRRKNNRKMNTRLGLPVGPQDPYVVEWQEVADGENPAYASWSNPGGQDD